MDFADAAALPLMQINFKEFFQINPIRAREHSLITQNSNQIFHTPPNGQENLLLAQDSLSGSTPAPR